MLRKAGVNPGALEGWGRTQVLRKAGVNPGAQEGWGRTQVLSKAGGEPRFSGRLEVNPGAHVFSPSLPEHLGSPPAFLRTWVHPQPS